MTTYKFGDKIRLIREKKGLTLKEIAEKVNVTESLISQIERNKVSPAIDTLLKIAEVLEIDVEYLFSDYKIEKKVNIVKKDNRKKIYVINHLSLIDGLLVYLIPDNIRVMGNAIYGKIPLLGLGFKLIGNIPVSKKDQGNTLYLYYTAKEYIEKGYSIVIFPEGTRSRMGGMQKFQNGAFYLALDAKADIVPIVFDTWNFLRPKSFFIRERNIHIQVLDTIKYENIKDFSPKEISNLTKTKMIEALINIREKNMYNYNYSSFIEELKKELSSLLKNSK